ncbi:MAG: Lsm family RNA-binding protein [Desulfurococcaceae archaeon]|jgi:small nuclear ribonucleoprotein (snRNP)-like protein
MAVSEASRRLIQELATFLDRRVKVVLDNGKSYDGLLAGFDHPSLNILLKDAVDNSGTRFAKIVVKGERISEIIILEEPLFDPEEFKEFILKEMKLQEHAIRVLHDIRAVEVLGRYRVSEEGVMGSGPMAETLYSLYKKYMELRKKKLQG